jgi:ABC-type sugar transport system ATPase subunit
LKGVQLRIKPGEHVVILGRVGSGKTTLHRLVLGLYTPTKGTVSLDGIDLRQLDPADVRRNIGYVAQDPMLFYGTLRDWVDFELLAHVARKRPDWHIVLIGQQLADLTPIQGLTNVHLLGQKQHSELPAYCKGFDVGMIPYRIDERMTFVNPLKLREYVSAGLPVVSTPVPEVTRLSHLAHVATTKDEFVLAIERALNETTAGQRAKRSRAMADETWAARVAQVMRTVDEISERKHQR